MPLLLLLAAGVDEVDEVTVLGVFSSLLEGDAVVEADAATAVCA
ncbi:TPA: hypothetical protein ACIE3B_000527 [Streptococcus pyogenes]